MGKFRTVDTIVTAKVPYKRSELINGEFLLLSALYQRVKASLKDADAVQRFRNNIAYKKYDIRDIQEPDGYKVRAVSVKTPNITRNCSVLLELTEEAENEA